MVSWADPHLGSDLAKDLELATRQFEAMVEHRHLIACSFCGRPALTWTPQFSLCDECLDEQEGLD